MNRAFVLGLLVLGMLASCDDKKGGDDDEVASEPVILDSSEYTYKLEESTGDLTIWTTPCTKKVRTNDLPPEETRSGISISAARNEYEPFQILLGPSAGEVSVSMELFSDLGQGHSVKMAEVGFEEGWSEQLTPIAQGGVISLTSSHSTPVWITVYIPEGAPAGSHHGNITVQNGDTQISIPVELYVFDFAIPSEIHYASQLNLGISELVPPGGNVDDAKDMLFAHRFTPKSVTWPSGFNWGITWENSASSDQCNVLWDEPDEPDQYSIGWLSKRYILGEGWNGTGFPNAMIFQFVDNSTPRPSEFCGISRGDHYGSDEFNAEWSEFLGALNTYLADEGLDEKAYYYVQNEPQNEEDHLLANHLCRLTKNAAPGLRIAISEEPKPEIAEAAAGDCGFDIWIAHVRAYQKDYAWQRQQDHGEQVWLYSLDHDPDPYFNPTAVAAEGINQRIIPWVSFGLRATGWAYYDANRFFSAHRPTVRAEILREGFEDYEYLYLANDRAGGGAYPRVNEISPVDQTVQSVASSLTSWTRNPDALMKLRHELGLYIEGTSDTLPVLEADGDQRPAGEYYINFQDPEGEPSADPLTIDGNTWMKIGWTPYDDELGYGWYGENVDNAAIVICGYDDVSGYSEAQKSYVYDDYGRDNLFEFALENGVYQVTVGAGRPGRGYPGDPHTVVVEGTAVIDDEPTSDAEPVIERTIEVDLMDGRLSLETGGLSPTTGEWSYTFMAYMIISPT
ncbi:MAG: hypothetical protein GY854_12485 [Deltaproteobacteria bacterium]|nr:hypothetical protein [Deltaproteobacteria bacterium]